ncbi:hypothetical protein [Paracerasibacillus soli]|uniref:Uncharacterized protein n=1 Tax=Paracerasibacillus soli TaxID=480284 RepID=A0ABU5CST6_9BACI|nr:hypothetical protein [Virgibacillus soli]MDY0409444.1 hypothetical protein [Virgibacillus soli]
MYTVKEIDKLTDEQVVILKTSQISVDFTDTHSTRIILNFEPRHVIDVAFHISSGYFSDHFYRQLLWFFSCYEFQEKCSLHSIMACGWGNQTIWIA